MPRRAHPKGGFVISEHWRENLRLKLEDFVDSLVVQGAKAIKREIDALETACERGPDPAEDASSVTVEEPSND